ncbi:hypothetical protein [Mesorhizobium sp. LjNodule214]|uniref:hypothetical protein n=1 Tax=Mesorhizobium sp. LjNodule214 TaxID=3342252 RepID=UPI003ED0CD19
MSLTRRIRSLSMMMAHRRTYSLSIIATGIAAVAGAASGDGTAAAIGVMATIAGGAIAGVSGCSTGSRLFAFTQFRTENRYALFLELLFVSTQFRTENRYALFLELLFVSTQFRTENRYALFLELLQSHVPSRLKSGWDSMPFARA